MFFMQSLHAHLSPASGSFASGSCWEFAPKISRSSPIVNSWLHPWWLLVYVKVRAADLLLVTLKIIAVCCQCMIVMLQDDDTFIMSLSITFIMSLSVSLSVRWSVRRVSRLLPSLTVHCSSGLTTCLLSVVNFHRRATQPLCTSTDWKKTYSIHSRCMRMVHA